MRLIIVFFIALFGFTSCTPAVTETTDNTNSEQELVPNEDKPELSQEEQEKVSSDLITKVIDASSLDLQMNGESKWRVNAESFTQLMKIKQQIYIISGNMQSYEVASYNEMGAEFLEFVEQIKPVENTDANIQFQKIIQATNEQCMFMLESSLQQSQISVINLSVIYDEVPKYFESSDK